jgi:osmotically-inducible protein OsmY
MASDATIRTRVRSILTRHWIDLRAIQIRVFRGVIRLSGTLRHQGAAVSTVADRAKLEEIHTAIRRIQGVRRVHVQFDEDQLTVSEQTRTQTAAERTRSEARQREAGEILELDGSEAIGLDLPSLHQS